MLFSLILNLVSFTFGIHINERQLMYLYSKQYNKLVNTFTGRYIFYKTKFSTKQVYLQVQNNNSMVNTFSAIGVSISFTLWNP